MPRGFPHLLDDVWGDLGYAFRTLVRTPGFGVAVVSLGLAVGATGAVYGTVDWLLHRPPRGVSNPDEIIGLRLSERGREEDRRGAFGFSYAQYEAIEAVQDAFTDVAAYGKLLMMAGGDDWSEQVVFQFVSGSYFPLLGARPLLGRMIRPEDDVEGAVPAVVLSYGLWQSRFGGDPEVLGRPIRLQGGEGRIVGVMPRDFEEFSLDWNSSTELWLPLRTAATTGMGVMLGSPATFFPVLGRLRPGVDIDEATARAQRWVADLPQARIRIIEPNAIAVRRVDDMRISRSDEARSFLGALLVVCGLILVAACFNVANFFLGRAARRRREMALRTALGAAPSRMMRQLATEAAVLAVATAAVSGVIGLWIASTLARMPNLYLGIPVRGAPITTAGAVDTHLVGVTVALGTATAVCMAFLPMLSVFGDPMDAIRGSHGRWSWGRIRPTARQGLLAFQVALAVVLSITATLYAQGFRRALSTDSGYAEPSRLLFAQVTSAENPRGTFHPFYEQLLERIEAEAWAVSAALTYNPPYSVGWGTVSRPDAPDGAFEVTGDVASPDLFATLGIPLVAGRELASDDGRDVAIINRTLADRLWPGEDPVGQQFLYTGDLTRVVGVVDRERCEDLLAPLGPCAWRGVTDGPSGRTVFIRTVGPAEDGIEPLRALLAEMGPSMVITDAQSVASFLADRIRAQRVSAVASMALALFGIVLLTIGYVSLFVAMVRESRRELAIRMALGATQGRIVRVVVRHGVILSVLGAVGGVGGALVVSRRLSDQFYETSATDPTTYLIVPLGVLALAGASVGWAALRATYGDSMEHLQTE